MAIYNWPEPLRPSQMSMALVSNSRVFRGKFSGVAQTASTPGTRWRITLTFNNLTDDESRKLESLFVKLDGMANRVKCRDFGRDGAAAKGTPKVSVAGQMGVNLTTNGWTPGALVLEEGDYFVVNGELKMATANITANSSGVATLQFGPPLRRSPALNATIDTVNTWSNFMLAENENGVDREPAFNNNITFTLEEDIV